MVDTKKFVDYLINNLSVEEFVGVSDSTLKYVINEVTNRGLYTPFTNEGDAVAYAAGRTACCHKTAVLIQNSGLTNAASPLTSLTTTYGIFPVFVIGHRGSTPNDEPQHKFLGKKTEQLIHCLTDSALIVKLNGSSKITTETHAISNSTLFFLVEPKTFSKVDLINQTDPRGKFSRVKYIEKVVDFVSQRNDTFVLSTTGFTSRELMTFGEVNPHNFYMFGSMGCLISFAAGVARSKSNKKFIVLDGDGSFLMRPEAAYVVGLMKLPNIIHVIFENDKHLSTGGQTIPTDRLDTILSGCVGEVTCLNSPAVFDEFLRHEILYPESCTCIVKVSPEVPDDLPRPQQTPKEILDNFIQEVMK